MNYVDGFVLPVPKKKIAAYRSMAKISAKVWLDHGAMGFCESVADDVPFGKRTSFPRSVKLKRGETVVFSWIVYKSRAHRDKVMAQGDEGSAHRQDDAGRHAVRSQAHDLRRLQDDRRSLPAASSASAMSLTLHFHPLSSFCHKALIALYENDTPFERRIVDLGDPADAAAFKKLWPCGQFPVLRDERRAARFRSRASSSSISTGTILGRPSSFPPIRTGIADAVQGSLLRSASARAHAEGGRRPSAAGRQEGPHGVEDAMSRLPSRST